MNHNNNNRIHYMKIKILDVPKSIDVEVIPNFDGGYLFRVNQDFVITFLLNDTLHKVTVKENTTSDGDSVPRLLFIYTLFKGLSFLPAIVHDSLYGNHLLSRGITDLLFYELMIYRKVPKWKAWCIYKGVQMFGETRYFKEV